MPNSDFSELQKHSLDFAMKILGQYGIFHPFGFYINKDEKTEIIKPNNNTDHLSTQELMDVLMKLLVEQIKLRNMKYAIITYFGTMTTPKGNSTSISMLLINKDGSYSKADYPLSVEKNG
jgi:hypothetical protein